MARSTADRVAAAAVALAVMGFGAALLWLAWRVADQRWFDHHMMPVYWAWDDAGKRAPEHWRKVWTFWGGVLLVLGPLLGWWVARRGVKEAAASTGRYSIAIVAALLVSEAYLHFRGLGNPDSTPGTMEIKIGQPDPRYGWIYVPSRVNVVPNGLAKTPIEYAINAQSNRAARVDALPDPEAPTILFAGESITAGHGFPYEQSYPALVGAALGVQVVNLGVHGYGTDQAYLRLIDALPQLKHPVAIVTFFFPPMIERMNQDSHPHFVLKDGGLVLSDEVSGGGFLARSRIAHVWKFVFPYHDSSTLEVAKAIMRSTAEMAHARGAVPIFVNPWCSDAPPPHGDEWLNDELFREQGLTVVDAAIGGEQIPGDNHPSAAATRRLVDAVVAALRAAGIGSS